MLITNRKRAHLVRMPSVRVCVCNRVILPFSCRVERRENGYNNDNHNNVKRRTRVCLYNMYVVM